MAVTLTPLSPPPVTYPESDGKPMADNTKQARWIVVLFDNLLALFAGTPDVFIAADLLWYPVEGEPKVRAAPDVFVAFGRPKGDRGSYKQWEEGGVAPQVVFEVLSPGNRYTEMADKLDFYDRHGAEEYYVYDPDENNLMVYLRRGEVLRRARPADGFVSPRLGIRFQLTAPEMTVYRPDGRPFLTFDQLDAERVRAEEARRLAVERAEQADKRAEQADKRAEQADKRAEQAEAEVERLRRLLGTKGQTDEPA